MCLVAPLRQWEEACSQPIAVASCLPTADNERLGAWRTQKLCPIEDVDLNRVAPYLDPILKNNEGEYAGFLRELSKRNMIGFSSDRKNEGMLGILCVKKNPDNFDLYLIPGDSIMIFLLRMPLRD